jgi:acyl carrier protein
METLGIAQSVRRFILDNYLLGSDYQLKDSDSFLDHSIIDSIGILQLVTFLQDSFSITVDDEELIPENLDSIQGVSAYVRRKLNGKGESFLLSAANAASKSHR